MTHSPTMPRYLLQEGFSTRYATYPEQVILNMQEEIKEFYEAIAKMQNYDRGCVDDILMQIVAYLTDYIDARDGLTALAYEVRHTFNCDDRFEDGDILATATLRLGYQMLANLKTYGIYTEDELLPYEMVNTGDWPDHYSPVLSKLMEE